MFLRIALLIGFSLSGSSQWQPKKTIQKTQQLLTEELTGSQFLELTSSLSLAEREEAFMRGILAGQLPNFYRSWMPIHVSNRSHRLTFFVKPNYLAIGSDEDYLIAPLNWYSVKAIMSITDSIIPTPKMVDLIYDQSDIKLRPYFLEPGPQMVTNAYLAIHQQHIDQSLFDYQLSSLIVGHKKDIVLSNRLRNHPDRIAIYGWHQDTAGTPTPVQPLSLWHGARYSDYSHGVRLVHRKALLDGNPIEIRTVLQDPELADLLSDEGPINVDQLLTDPAGKFGQAH